MIQEETGSGMPARGEPVIAVVNESTVVSDTDVMDLVAALQIQHDRDFQPLWGGSVRVIFKQKTLPLPHGFWELVILDNSDQAGALGYHELTANGDPLGKVFAEEDLNFGTSWTITASHEFLEMKADPLINTCSENDSSTEAQFYAYEVCDACEDDQFGYEIVLPDNSHIVSVSDFVLPRWFSAAEIDKPPYDFRGHISKPLELIAGGYISIFSPSRGWTQVTDQLEPAIESRFMAQKGHRRHTRMMGTKNWRRSDK